MQQRKEVRDAGEVAFGILVFGVLLVPASMFAGGLLLFQAVARLLPTVSQPWRVGIAATPVWILGMALVLRHYRNATRHWTTERRGNNVFLVLEGISLIVAVAGPSFFVEKGEEWAFKMYLEVIFALFVVSHVSTYLLLRYRPLLKDLIVWGSALIVGTINIIRA